MGRFRSRAELRAIFAKLGQAREDLFPKSPAEVEAEKRRSIDLALKFMDSPKGKAADLRYKRRRNALYARAGRPLPYPDAGLPAPPKPKTTKDWMQRSLGDWETKARTLSKERARFGPVDGPAILEKAGGRRSVSFSRAEMETFKANPDMIFSHNHPNGSAPSMEDYKLAKAANFKEMRVASRTGRDYSLKRPDEGWPELSFDTRLEYQKLSREFQRPSPAGEAEAQIRDLTPAFWERAAARDGFIFEKRGSWNREGWLAYLKDRGLAPADMDRMSGP